MSSPDPSANDRVAGNVAQWTSTNREHTDAAASEAWRREELLWGVFGIPDRWIGDPAASTSSSSAAARRSTRPGSAQRRAAGRCRPDARTARDRAPLQRETGIEFPLVEAPAEDVPLPDASFDLAISEYGASLWADPERWLAEAARLLRPGGRLVFLTMSTLAHLCTPDDDEQPTRTSSCGRSSTTWETEWEGYSGAEYHLSHGDWIQRAERERLRLDGLHELQAPDDARTHQYYYVIPAEWGTALARGGSVGMHEE